MKKFLWPGLITLLLLFSLSGCEVPVTVEIKVTPVIIIPGMTASMNWDCILNDNGCEIEENWGWTPFAKNKYQALIEHLIEELDAENVIIFHYDWRKPLQDNASLLEDRINQILKSSHSKTVNIIGHSMGGLIGRAYVQTFCDNEDCEVSHLISIGSPHFGSVKSYPLWEGANFYNVGLIQKIAFGLLIKHYQKNIDNSEPVTIIRNQIPSILDLLPTSNYLHREIRGFVFPEEKMVFRNLYLANLNRTIDELFNRGTQIIAIYKDDLKTPSRFLVGPEDDSSTKWPDGEPLWTRDNKNWFLQASGDKTVTAVSARLSDRADQYEVQTGVHTDLSVQIGTIEKISDVLDIQKPQQLVDEKEDSIQIQIPIVLVVYGDIDLDVINIVTGDSVGSSASTATIQDAVFYSDKNFKFIIIPATIAQSYRVEIDGVDSEFELYIMELYTERLDNIDFIDLWIEPDLTNYELIDGKLVYTLEYAEDPNPKYSFSR